MLVHVNPVNANGESMGLGCPPLLASAAEEGGKNRICRFSKGLWEVPHSPTSQLLTSLALRDICLLFNNAQEGVYERMTLIQILRLEKGRTPNG
jgi:hypothetical protein